ncbi:TcaA NTF2-like domain-containing protein [Rossellomorea vietnamensis]|uniref:TcaA protein NTF2-like domain-containing protein n=1 Tax=Rossellomorea vietnamensis TaxID=218284 RepID=A0A0P6VW67_9BACI|nr:hypothetical protein [Rossellomorea vietnamensis]KPL59236.1 hypothetical protein AM506_11960 [Rossellomorea vietnamensis]
MKIEGFDIVKKLSSTDNAISVYVVKQNNEHFLLRLADYSHNKNGLTHSTWYETYEEYQLTITNYKNLPRVTSISMISESQVYSLGDFKEGKLLTEAGSLALDETRQLIDAVRHLHSKKIVHGAIAPENIWITQKGKVLLYGAGELKALGLAQDNRQSSDIKQLVDVISEYARIDEGDIEILSIKNPTSINELESVLANAKPTDQRKENEEHGKQKHGLVEKEKPKPTEKVMAPVDIKEKKEKRTLKVEETEKADNGKEERTRYAEPNRKFGSIVKKLGMGVVTVLALLFIIGQFTDSEKERAAEPTKAEVSSEAGVSSQVEEVKEPENTSTAEEADEQTETEEPVQQEKPAPNFTKEQVDGFMNQYNNKSIQAVNDRNFAIVENLLDPNGEAYKTQREYIDYLESKGITEENVDFQLDDYIKVDHSTYKISTSEQYYIYYDDGSVTEKWFDSSYILKVLGNNNLAVNKMLYTEETYSETVREATDYSYEEDSSSGDSFYSDDSSVYRTGTDSNPGGTLDDGGAIESAVRLHYGSISSDDFTTGYNQFSSGMKKKVTQKGWEKGLQANMYDEITYIEVQQIDDNKGRAYIEMTSYDDNQDGTTLVQEWAGSWDLLKENNRWTLDNTDLSKVNSWVEEQ